MAKNTGKVREFCQSGEVGTLSYTEQNIQFKGMHSSILMIRVC